MYGYLYQESGKTTPSFMRWTAMTKLHSLEVPNALVTSRRGCCFQKILESHRLLLKQSLEATSVEAAARIFMNVLEGKGTQAQKSGCVPMRASHCYQRTTDTQRRFRKSLGHPALWQSLNYPKNASKISAA